MWLILFKKAKLTELENKIADVRNLETKTALTTVENKTPDVSNLVKQTDYNTRVTEIENKLTNHNHDKYIGTQEFNKLAAVARIAQAKLITKTDFDAKMSNLHRKITTNKAKHLLVKNELNKLKTFDSSYFIGKSNFEEDGTQNYLLFQPIISYFKVNMITNTDYVSSWKSKGLSAKSIKPPTMSDKSLTPELNYYRTKARVKFTGSCLKQPKVSYTHSNIVNIYIVYELGASGSNNSNPTLKTVYLVQLLWLKMLILMSMCILVMELDLVEDRIFDRSFSFPGGRFCQNVLIFGADTSSSAYIDNKKKFSEKDQQKD